MANKTVNKKIFRAMSIGLAAMMTVQPILATPVFADDADDENKYSADNEHSSESADEARESVDEAQSVAEAVEATLESVNPGEAGTTEVTSEDGSVEVIDNAQAIIDATYVEPVATENTSEATENSVVDETPAESQTQTVSDVLEQASEELEAVDIQLTIAEAKADVISGFSTTDGVDSEAKKANDAVDNAETAISDETAANEAIEEAVESGNESVEAAIENYNKGANAVSEANTIVVEAEATYTELVNTVSDATTVEEAQKAYDDLDVLINDTQVKIADKKVALDAAKDALSTMVDSVKEHEVEAEAAREAFEKAEADYNAAKDAYNSGKDAYAKHAKEIEAFNEAYETAKTNLEAAEANLQTVSDKADALATAVENAQTALANSGALARAETVTTSMNSVKDASESSKTYWTDMNNLFESLMRNYYLPEKLGAIDADTATLYWNNNAEDQKHIDSKLKPYDSNNDYNFCVVTYKDAEGNSQTKYFNYKRELAVDGKTPNSIVIFEKRDVEIEANKLLRQGKDISGLEGVEVEGYYVSGVSGKPTFSTIDELKSSVSGVNEINGVYYKVNTTPASTDNKTIAKVNGIDVVNDENTKTVVTVGNETAKDGYTMVGGKAAKEYISDVTMTVYKKDQANSDYEFESEEAARAAALEIAGSEDNVVDIIVNSTQITDISEESETIIELKGNNNSGIAKLKNGDLKKKLEAKQLFESNDNSNESFLVALKNLAKLSEEEIKECGFSSLRFEDDKMIYSMKTETENKTVWSYSLDYWKKDSETTENGVLTKVEKYDAKKVMAVVKQNQNFFDYKDGKDDLADSTLVQSSDSDFQNFLGLGNKYNTLKEQAEAEKVAVTNAKENVEALKKVVNDLRGKVPESTLAISDLPENNVAISQAKINSLIKTLSDLGVDFDGKDVEELTLDDIKDALKAEESKLEALENRVKELKDSMDDVAIQLAETVERINAEAEETNAPSETQPEAVTPGNTETAPTEVVTPGNTETLPSETVTPGNTETTPTEDATTADTAVTPSEESTTASVSVPTTSSSDSTVASSPSYEATTETTSAPSISVIPQTVADITALPIAGVAGARVDEPGRNGGSANAISAGVAGARVDRPDGISGDGEILETGDGTLLDEELIKESDTIVEDDVIKNKKAVTIKDDEVPLSSLAEDEAKKISWWWLLLIALLGATGEEMYRRHKNKKEERERLNSEGK